MNQKELTYAELQRASISLAWLEAGNGRLQYDAAEIAKQLAELAPQLQAARQAMQAATDAMIQAHREGAK